MHYPDCVCGHPKHYHSKVNEMCVAAQCPCMQYVVPADWVPSFSIEDAIYARAYGVKL